MEGVFQETVKGYIGGNSLDDWRYFCRNMQHCMIIEKPLKPVALGARSLLHAMD
jgi:hypothetical protein